MNNKLADIFNQNIKKFWRALSWSIKKSIKLINLLTKWSILVVQASSGNAFLWVKNFQIRSQIHSVLFVGSLSSKIWILLIYNLAVDTSLLKHFPELRQEFIHNKALNFHFWLEIWACYESWVACSFSSLTVLWISLRFGVFLVRVSMMLNLLLRLCLLHELELRWLIIIEVKIIIFQNWIIKSLVYCGDKVFDRMIIFRASTVENWYHLDKSMSIKSGVM